MLGVLDPAVHVHATTGTRVALNGRIGVHDLELVRPLRHPELVARDDGDLRERRPGGLPTFCAAADVVIGALTRDAHLDGIARAPADKRAAREVRGAGLHAVVYRRMD